MRKSIVLFVLIQLLVSGGVVLGLEKMDIVKYEAEDAFFRYGVKKSSDIKGFSGKGYLENFVHEGSAVIFAVNVSERGRYNTILKYLNKTDEDKSLSIVLNGIDIGRAIFRTDSKSDSWSEKSEILELRKGINTISYSFRGGDSGGVMIDSLEVENALGPGKIGASLSFNTIEAVNTRYNGEIVSPDRTYRNIASEAMGRKAVRLAETEDFIEFETEDDINSLVIRYCIPDSAEGEGINTRLGLYVDGVYKRDVYLNSKYSWVYGQYPWSNDPSLGLAHNFFDESKLLLDDEIRAGSNIRLQKDTDDDIYIIVDIVETEKVSEPYQRPENYLCITDFGAVPNNGEDDSKALKKTISEAKARNKGVWIPEGTFTLKGSPILVSDVTIRGAGIWYSILEGRGATFQLSGNNSSFYDFAIFGATTTRVDSAKETAFDGFAGTGSTIQNIWIEHVKAGIWTKSRTSGLYIIGNRIRNTFADGINLTKGSKNSVVEQNHIRNTGDDGIAMWSTVVATKNNIIRYNTVQLPWLASNIAVYGGTDNRIENNLLYDTIAFGAGINISTRHNPAPFRGKTKIINNTLIRTGSREYNRGFDIGAIWIDAADKDIDGKIEIKNNRIYDSSTSGVTIKGPYSISEMIFQDILIDTTDTYGIHILNSAKGEATFRDIIMKNIKSKDIQNDDFEDFHIKN